MLVLVERGGFDLEIVRLAEVGCDRFVHSLRVDLGDLGILLLVAVFVPDGDAHGGSFVTCHLSLVKDEEAFP